MYLQFQLLSNYSYILFFYMSKQVVAVNYYGS